MPVRHRGRKALCAITMKCQMQYRAVAAIQTMWGMSCYYSEQ